MEMKFVTATRGSIVYEIPLAEVCAQEVHCFPSQAFCGVAVLRQWCVDRGVFLLLLFSSSVAFAAFIAVGSMTLAAWRRTVL